MNSFFPRWYWLFWFFIVPSVAVSQELNPQALDEILSFSESFCGKYLTEGSTGDVSASGAAEAELKGLLSKLATLGVKGTASIDTQQYVGVLHEEVRGALQDARDCKVMIWQDLRETVMKRANKIAAIPLSPGAPSGQLLKSPGSAEMVETVDLGSQSIGLYACSNRRDSSEKKTIVCSFVLTREVEGVEDYKADYITRVGRPKLTDDFHVDHSLVRLYFFNGRGQQQPTVNLARDDSVWFAIEFADGADDISTARIVFTGYSGRPQLRGPVTLPE